MVTHKRLMAILLPFDSSKAFHKVSPSCLLSRLHWMDFSTTALSSLRSYHTGKEQLVVSKPGRPSPWLNSILYVPQEAVLRRLFFCLYINYICDALDERRIKHISYADARLADLCSNSKGWNTCWYKVDRTSCKRCLNGLLRPSSSWTRAERKLLYSARLSM